MDITLVETQSENHPYGDPDQGVPEEALRMFMEHYPTAEEDSVCMGEHEFIIWRGEDAQTFYANAWTIPEVGAEREYTTYYEFKVTGGPAQLRPQLDRGHAPPPPVSIEDGVRVIRELSQIIIDKGITDDDEARHNINMALIRAQAWVFAATLKYE